MDIFTVTFINLEYNAMLYFEGIWCLYLQCRRIGEVSNQWEAWLTVSNMKAWISSEVNCSWRCQVVRSNLQGKKCSCAGCGPFQHLGSLAARTCANRSDLELLSKHFPLELQVYMKWNGISARDICWHKPRLWNIALYSFYVNTLFQEVRINGEFLPTWIYVTKKVGIWKFILAFKQFLLSEQNWNDIIKHVGSSFKCSVIYTDHLAILLPINNGYFKVWKWILTLMN
jgi:hypothetical protein